MLNSDKYKLQTVNIIKQLFDFLTFYANQSQKFISQVDNSARIIASNRYSHDHWLATPAQVNRFKFC